MPDLMSLVEAVHDRVGVDSLENLAIVNDIRDGYEFHSYERAYRKLAKGIDLLKNMDRIDVQIKKSRGHLVVEVVYKPFKEDIPKDFEDSNSVEKAPEGTPAGGGLQHGFGSYVVHRLNDSFLHLYIKKNWELRWEGVSVYAGGTNHPPATGDRLHVEVLSASARIGILNPKANGTLISHVHMDMLIYFGFGEFKFLGISGLCDTFRIMSAANESMRSFILLTQRMEGFKSSCNGELHHEYCFALLVGLCSDFEPVTGRHFISFLV
ncbi:hypothetical protein HHK36_031643 [Tetracentron sinense]|uniref:Uncharacterized protein n=1 Tax=Tetracentron sinense TaxID=13715 RepID=A0A834YC61_TETSI|nr:hypothetical protein HHK36_031643 [Tetracentron sinense]